MTTDRSIPGMTMLKTVRSIQFHGKKNHSHQGEGHQYESAGNLKVAFLLNLCFTIIEVAGGLWTKIAILTDAVHGSGNCISLSFARYLQKIASRERTSAYTSEYRRFDVLEAMIVGVILVAGLAFILWNAVKRLMDPEPVLTPGMISLAVIGVVMNGAPVLRVRKGESLTVWTLDGEHHVFTTHLVREPGSPRDAILRGKASFRDRLDAGTFEHVTVDVEIKGEHCASMHENDSGS